MVEDGVPYSIPGVICFQKSLSVVNRIEECELIPFSGMVSSAFFSVSPGFVDLPTLIIAGSLVSCWHSLNSLLHPQQSLREREESLNAVGAYWEAAEEEKKSRKI